jgi:Ca-activated chloride channel family protein
MEESAAYFIDQLRDLPGVVDEAEIVKFGTTIQVVDPPGYTSNKALLADAIYDPLDVGNYTALYDAVVKAVETTIVRTKDRKAVILITDGADHDGYGNPQSVNDLNDAIDYAQNNGVPIFTVGLGQADDGILSQLADATGGQYFDSTTSDNLRNIYQQLADILFEDTYVLTYPSLLTPPFSLTIEATYSPAIKGDDTKEITSCP